MDDESFLKECPLPGQEDILGSNPTARTSAVETRQNTRRLLIVLVYTSFFLNVLDDVKLNKMHNKSLKKKNF